MEIGGLISFKFARPVFKLNYVRFLDIEAGKKSFVMAKTRTNEQRRARVPVGGNGKPSEFTPKNWFNLENLRIRLKTSGAIARLNVDFCMGGTFGVKRFLVSPASLTHSFRRRNRR